MARVSKKTNTLVQATPETALSKDSLPKTALYVRLSVEDNGKESDSLDSQIQYLQNYVAQHPEFSVYGIFADNGYSGTNYDRPDFQRMMEAAQKGEINCIIMKDLSRLGRNYIETGTLLQKICPMLSLRVIAINDGYDSENASSNAMMTMDIMNIANDMYAKDISRKLCSALQVKMERGEYIGNYAPYGYIKDPEDKNHLLIDEATAPIVERIFRFRSEGMGISSIARVLNDEDIPSPGRYRYENGIITNNNKKGSGLLWNRHVLTDILKNVVYIGNLAQARCRSALYKGIPFHWTEADEWVMSEDTHDAIISVELFEQVQLVNSKRSKAQKENSGKYSHLPKVENVFGKKLICADCGAVIKMVRSLSTKKDKVYYTFKCPVYIEHGERGCSSKNIRYAELSDAVLTAIRTQIKLFARRKEVLLKLQDKDRKLSKSFQKQTQMRQLEQQIRKKNSLRTSLYMDMKDGIISDDEYHYTKQKYTDEINALNSQLQILQDEMQEATTSTNKYSHWMQMVEQYQDVKELSKELVDTFVAEIKLHENQEIEIIFNHKDEFEAALKEYKKRRKEVA